jgi:hypothetical protein
MAAGVTSGVVAHDERGPERVHGTARPTRSRRSSSIGSTSRIRRLRPYDTSPDAGQGERQGALDLTRS